MTDPIPELMGVATQAIVENAGRLGLTWNLRMATVAVGGISPAMVSAVYDGDTEAIGMVNMLGYLTVGNRVWAIEVPPAGNFIVGCVDFTLLLPCSTATYFNASSGTTTSASFANAPGPPVLTLTKKYPAHATQLLFTQFSGAWCNGAVPSGVEFGVTVEGTTFELAKMTFNTAAQHHVMGAQRQIDAEPGEASYTLLWRRSGGTGTITIDGADVTTFSVMEVPIEH